MTEKMIKLFITSVFILNILQISGVQGFSNFFSEIFDDLRIGKQKKNISRIPYFREQILILSCQT